MEAHVLLHLHKSQELLACRYFSTVLEIEYVNAILFRFYQAGFADAALNNNRHSGVLPDPKPPTSTREELLEGKQNVLQKMDQHAMQVRLQLINSESVIEISISFPGKLRQHRNTEFGTIYHRDPHSKGCRHRNANDTCRSK